MSRYFCIASVVLAGMLVACPAPAQDSAARGTLHVRVLDGPGGRTVPARVNVIGPDHAYYEPAPADNPLAAYSLKRRGNRSNVGPLRYYGSFFYTGGDFTVRLPPGVARVEAWRGYEYFTGVAEPQVGAGRTTEITVIPQAMIHAAQAGWHALDPHLHFDRTEPDIDGRIASLLAASGVELGYIMTQRSTHGFGAASAVTESGVSMASGYEIVTPQLAHVNVLMPDGEIPAAHRSGADNLTRSNVRPITEIYDQAHAAGGVMQHDHGGYGQEITADVVLGKSDWVELLQFGSYRIPIGSEGWYRLLNSGYRYPLAGGSDYPACRVFSDSVTFVPGRAADLRSAIGRLLRGESFATSGPLLFLSANGKGPGADLTYTGAGQETVDVRVLAASADLPITSLELIRDGEVAAEWHDARPVYRKELAVQLKFGRSGWLAARCSGPGTAHAHTNPVWVVFNGLAPFQPEAAHGVAREIERFAASNISPEAKRTVEAAAAKAWARADGAAPRAAEVSDSRYPAEPYTPDLHPAIANRPPERTVTLAGQVVDAAGEPVSGAVVAVRGGSLSAPTGRDGGFVLAKVDTDPGLFLRVRKAGYATVNTSYLNARAPRSSLRVVYPAESQLRNIAPPAAASAAIVVLGGAGAGEVVATSPACRFSAVASGVSPLAVCAFPVVLQEIEPVERDPHEPNLIVTLRSGRDLVLPAFPGQVTYAEVRR